MKPINPLITFGVCSVGNTPALLMCLSSVLNGHILPKAINVRLEGEFPSFNNFYLEQIASWASLQGVEFSLSVGPARGVRNARQWQLDNCKTELLWMGDDDCVFAPACLSFFLDGIDAMKPFARAEDTWGFIVGSKPDINNRRGYGDFSTAEIDTKHLNNYDSFNQFYTGEPKLVRVRTLDTGNVLLNVQGLRKFQIGFNAFDESYNSGGEDTLLALQCYAKKVDGYFFSHARAVHMEKPQTNFGEFAARGEMLLRACDLLKLDKEIVKKEFMPFLKCHAAVE